MKRTYWALPAVAAVLVVGMAVVTSCAGEAPPRGRLDGGGQRYDTGGFSYDQGYSYDQGFARDTTVDQYVWPDTTSGTPDTWPWQQDTYAGTPFGCQTDDDCFGKICCPTPWGIKLCADSCNSNASPPPPADNDNVDQP